MLFLGSFFSRQSGLVITFFSLEHLGEKNQCFGSGSARIRIKKCLLDPDPHGHMRIRIRIQEVKKPAQCTDSLGENRTGRIKVFLMSF